MLGILADDTVVSLEEVPAIAALHLMRNLMPRGENYGDAEVATNVANAALNAAMPVAPLHGASVTPLQMQVDDDQE